MLKLMSRGTIALSCLMFLGCAHSPVDDPSDPLEPVNRAVFSFNETLDHYVARPAAKGYTRTLPEPVRIGLHNFFNNLTYPTVIINDALQGKFKRSGLDTTRFLMNTVYGLGGFLDPATMVGLEPHDADFGTTFGVWGLGQGWYLMLPVLGPSSNRDLAGRIGGIATNPTTYVNYAVGIPTAVMNGVDTRAQLLGADSVLEQQLDRYIFVRSAYLQHRESQVYDGHPPKEQYDFGDDTDTPPETKAPASAPGK